MQVKVLNTRMNRVYSDANANHILAETLVADGKFVLVECGATTKAGVISPWDEEDFNTPTVVIGNILYKPIIISETEKIEVGDTFYVSDLPHDPPSLFKAEKINRQTENQHGKIWIGHKDYIVEALCKRVIVLPEQFSPNDLQAIADGKLKDGDKVVVECVYDWDKTQSPMTQYHFIKLNSQGHAIIHKFEGKKTYSREELIDCCKKYFEYLTSNYHVQDESIPEHVSETWFRENV